MLSSAILLIILFSCLELLYFRLATRFNIIDKPNSRSSHAIVTIRGGGIIFPLAFIMMTPISGNNDYICLICLTLVTCLSFLDDIKNLNSQVRLVIQSLCVAGMVYSVMPEQSFFLILIAFILVTGIINAYNFMDGINGITAFYSIITISTLYWINNYISKLMPDLLFVSLITALLVFSYFNARRRARCFAGDVGSVSIAFIICFLLLRLCIQTKTFFWILFLGVYGVDTVFTICCRLIRKESIFQAHRSHFYQFLVNEAGWSHLKVSSVYAIVQLLFNVIIIFSYMRHIDFPIMLSIIGILVIYTIFRLQYEGRYRLFTAY